MRPTSLFSALLGAVALSALGTTAGYADTITDDPLHGVCAGCIDNGTNTPLVSQPFSFSVSPGPQTGTLLIEVLEPTASQVPGALPTISIVGGSSFTTSLHSGEFNSGDLGSFLGISASPNNPIGGFGAGGVTSYSVYSANLGTQTLTANGPTCDAGGPGPGVVSGCLPKLNVSSLPNNSYVVGFLETSTGNIATALSGALLVPGPVLGAGLPGLIAACSGLIALARRRRRNVV